MAALATPTASMARFVLVLVCLLGAAAAADPFNTLANGVGEMIPDPPIVSTAIQLLDGSDWTVTGTGQVSETKCIKGLGFNISKSFNPVIPVDYNPNALECGRMCAASAHCAAGVFVANIPPPPPAPPSSDCEFFEHTDWNPHIVDITVASPSKEECCGLCIARKECYVGVFYAGNCYLKDKGHATLPFNRSLRTACRPKRTQVVDDLPYQNPGCYLLPAEALQSNYSAPRHTACILENVRQFPVTLKGTVPGDLITDMQRANLIDEPYMDKNWQNSTMWQGPLWSYTRIFDADAALASSDGVLLVLDGVKTGASIWFNGHNVGNASDQFLRYEFEVKALLLSTGNNVTVQLDVSIHTDNRYMDCSGGWDWAPYSYTRDSQGLQGWTRGIWKSVYLAAVPKAGAVISAVSVGVFYEGKDWPTSALSRGAPFSVQVCVFLETATTVQGTVSVTGSWGEGGLFSNETVLPAGTTKINCTLNASDVDLWWPRGLGNQSMYSINATFVPATNPAAAVSTLRRVGFRMVAVVTGNDTNPEYVKAAQGREGTDTFTFMFRVNGLPVSIRGANMIPMEEMEGRLVPGMHRLLMESAAASNINMLRVWGGGVYPNEEWYNACDDVGIMVWQDLMYGTDDIGTPPIQDATQEAELRYQVRRVSQHPSLVLYCGCNECGGHGLYTTFVMQTVVSEDLSRPIRSASPFAGYLQGVHLLSQLPTGGTLAEITAEAEIIPAADEAAGALLLEGQSSDVPWPTGIEKHGPYQLAGGYSTRNARADVRFTPSAVVSVQPGFPIGPEYPGFMTTESGCNVFSSFESMSATLSPENWGINTPVFFERNYPCNTIIESYFGTRDLTLVGESALKNQLYLCMIAQGLHRKTNLESWRSTGLWGVLLWQLNSIWPTGGFSGIEYGTPVKGQVLGGRWKPTQYFLQASAFADITAACGFKNGTVLDVGDENTGPAVCFVRNDGPAEASIAIEVVAVNVKLNTSHVLVNTTQTLGQSRVHVFCMDGAPRQPNCTTFETVLPKVGCTANGTDCMLVVTTTTAGSTTSYSELLLGSPEFLQLPKCELKFTIVDPSIGGLAPVTIELEATAGPCAYVWLSTLAHGRFSRNAFLVRGRETVQFLPIGPDELPALKASLRVEDLGTALKQ